MKDYLQRNWQVLSIGGAIMVFGAYWGIGGLGGPPAEEDLKHVAGTIEKVVMHINENAIGQEYKRHAVIHLHSGSSYRYAYDQPGCAGLKTYFQGEPVELWVDDRITIGEDMIEIWAFKRGDQFVCTYEQSRYKYSSTAGTIRIVFGVIGVLIGALIIKQNAK